MKEHYSKEKDIIIKGTVLDDPFFERFMYRAQDYSGRLFLMELSHEVTATFKKTDPVTLRPGDAVVVRYYGLYGAKGCYVRKGDQIETKGQIVKLVFKDRGESIFIQSDKLYNETLKFSFDY